MTYDPGISGAEEYGTCDLCRGTGKLPPELEALHNKIAELEEKEEKLRKNFTQQLEFLEARLQTKIKNIEPRSWHSSQRYRPPHR